MKGYYFYDPEAFDNMEDMVDDDIKQLEEYYDTDIEPIPIESASYAAKKWNDMDDMEPVDIVVIFTHAGNNIMQMSSDNEKTEEDEKTCWRRKDIEELDEKKIDTLLLLGCNTGLDNPQDFPMKVSLEESVAYDYTMAEAFYKDKNADSIGRIIASDGSIWNGNKRICVL